MVNAQVKAPGTAENGYALLARTGWTATANTGNGGDGPYAGLFDGDAATYWNSNYGSPATNAYPHILTVDMLSAQTYEGVMIRPRNASRVPQNIIIRKSNDGVVWTDLLTTTAANAVRNQYF